METNHLIQPYLFFGGRCEEAIEFYRVALGAEVEMLMRFKEAPEQPPEGMLAPGYGDKIMHASFRIGKSTIMASDGCGEEASFAGFSLSIPVHTVEECDRIFEALSDGGTITMPLGETFWAKRFGMLTDKFGIGWMINLEA